MAARRLLRMLVPLLFVVLFAVGQLSADERPLIKIGVIVPLTGDMAFAGEEIRNAMTLARSEIPSTKYRYELIFEDNGLDLKRSAAAARKLIDADRVDAIVTLWPPAANVVAPITEEKAILHYAIAWDPSIAKKHKYILSHQLMMDAYVDATLKLLREKNVSRLAFFELNESGFNIGAELMKSRAGEFGIELVSFETFNPGQTDFKTEIARVRTRKPDGILVWAVMPEIEILLKQLNDLGYKGVVTGFFDVVQDLRIIDGREFVSEVSETARFAAKYKAEFGEESKLKGPNAYDILKLLARAYEACPDVKPSASELKAALTSVRDYEGAVGVVSIDRFGNSSYPAVVKKAEGGILMPR